MTKIAVIGGAGTLGAAVAYQLATNEKIEEICMIDINENVLLNHVMDLQNAFPGKKLYAGQYENMKGSDIVIITAGIPNRNDISTRNVFLEGNLKLFQTFGKKIVTYAPDAIVVTASNPVDVLNYFLHHEFGFRSEKLIGYTINDSLRFEWALRSVLSLSSKDRLFSPVIGEHGNSQVPLYSQLAVNDIPLTLTTDQHEQVTTKLKSWFDDFNKLGVNRTTGWTTALGMGKLVEKLMCQDESKFIGSSILNGQYGVRDISLGAPITINQQGILGINEWKISNEERQAYEKSAEYVRSLIENFVYRKSV